MKAALSGLQRLAKQIRHDSRSLTVTVMNDGVAVRSPFQEAVIVRSWGEYEQAIQDGRIAFPDAETCF